MIAHGIQVRALTESPCRCDRGGRCKCGFDQSITGYQWNVLHRDGQRATGKAKTRAEAWAASTAEYEAGPVRGAA